MASEEEQQNLWDEAAVHIQKVVACLRKPDFNDSYTAGIAFNKLFMLLAGDEQTLIEYMQHRNRNILKANDATFFGVRVNNLVQHMIDFSFTQERQQSIADREEITDKLFNGLTRIVDELSLGEEDRNTVRTMMMKHCLMFLPGGEGKLEVYADKHLDLNKKDKICDPTFNGLDYDLLVLRQAHERLSKESIDEIRTDYGHGCTGNCDCPSDEDF